MRVYRVQAGQTSQLPLPVSGPHAVVKTTVIVALVSIAVLTRTRSGGPAFADALRLGLPQALANSGSTEDDDGDGTTWLARAVKLAGALLPFCNQLLYMHSLFFRPKDPIYDPNDVTPFGTTAMVDALSLLGIVCATASTEHEHGDLSRALARGAGLTVFGFLLTNALIPEYVRDVDDILRDRGVDLTATFWRRRVATLAFMYVFELAAVASEDAVLTVIRRVMDNDVSEAQRWAPVAYAAVVAVLVGWFRMPRLLATFTVLYLAAYPDTLTIGSAESE